MPVSLCLSWRRRPLADFRYRGYGETQEVSRDTRENFGVCADQVLDNTLFCRIWSSREACPHKEFRQTEKKKRMLQFQLGDTLTFDEQYPRLFGKGMVGAGRGGEEFIALHYRCLCKWNSTFGSLSTWLTSIILLAGVCCGNSQSCFCLPRSGAG